ncbi:MAG: carotenoid oxygenase family protein [Oscillatoriales cyanobacterium C42_A2020_001]|nr:carotenoid oxygenase family protein [Leptolyngbyaceae cyanobacterium C42_A2020_001]
MATESPCYQSVPQAVLTASRAELTDLPLTVVEGSIPSKIFGHCFVVGPVGSVESGGLPYADGSPIFNGDGMVYRFDFDGSNTVRVTSRLAKTPCFYADRATHTNAQYAPYRFQNHGLSRFSLALGMRNQLNTALLPFRSQQDDRDRLLLTYDAGRPYEIDPVTLEVATPVGSNQEWRPESSLLTPFLPVLSTAHPCFDTATHELFTVNYGRSLGNFLENIPSIEAASQVPGVLAEWLEAIARLFRMELPLKFLLTTLATVSTDVWQFLLHQVETLTQVEIQDFVHLVRWNGTGALERWRLVLPDGSPLRIRQSLHQIGMTEHYIILVETSFSSGLAEVMNNPIPANRPLEREIHHLMTGPPSPDSVVYLVRREHLHHGQFPAKAELEVKVTAQPLTIPREVLHFAADYNDANGERITLHMGHVCASDAAEWLHDYDQLASDPSVSPPARLNGMVVYETDISVLGRYVIATNTGQILESQTLSQDPETWGVALYTFRDALPTGYQPSTIAQMYWYSGGMFPELLTEFVVQMFEDYRYRLVSIPELLQIAANHQGKPACLFRLDTESMAIADSYQFPCSTSADAAGYLINSPQFVPKANSPDDDATAGYLVCHVFVGDRCQIWIFDASHLSQGPLCKLGHPSLNFGFSLHTAWLPSLQPRTAAYNIPVRQDYQSLLSSKNQDIQTLFEQEIFPHYPS